MKLKAFDYRDVIFDRAYEKSEIPFTLDTNDYKDYTGEHRGDLFKQNGPFLIFAPTISSTRRVGPTITAPTRHYGSLYFTYLTKDPDLFTDHKLLESVAEWFSEQTIEGVRFRTFTPLPVSKANGFTAYDGVIHFDFELYRGG